MTEESVYILLLAIITVDFVVERILQYLNLKSAKKPIPDELEGVYDPPKYARSQQYHEVRTRFSMLTATLSFVLMFAAIYFGWFGWLDKWIRIFSPLEPLTTLIFFAILYVAFDLVSTPFALYQAFVVEERFGFNKMTQKTFWLDKLKGYLLTFIVGGILLSVLIYLLMLMGSDFWIYFWGVSIAFTLIMNVFYTTWILPLFNQLTPMAEGSLRESLEAYSRQVNFPLKNVFVMDGSRRSSKGNAFFAGLGKRKKVVFFDTLIANHSVEELTAIFAHEVGHYKKKHIILGTTIGIATMGLMLYLLSLMVYSSDVSWALGGDITALHLNILAFVILYTPVTRVLGLAGNALSRKNEYEADAYAVQTYAGAPLVSALKKLSGDHLSNLTPHPAYVFVHYSHPPLLQRVRAMEGAMRDGRVLVDTPTHTLSH